MSKIICDICGTVYPDNATACPICGYPRTEQENTEVEEAPVAAAAAAPKAVKGGRFSNKNVKKRNRVAASAAPERENTPMDPDDRDPNKGLVIVVAILAIAVVLVGLYIAMRFFRGAGAYDETQGTTTAATIQATTQATTVPEDTGIACTTVILNETRVMLNEVGETWQINAILMPQDTTDQMSFESSDERVATVSPDGQITAVGEGMAVITVTCGDVVQECEVNCAFETEPTETTQETTEATTEATSETTSETTEKEQTNTDGFKLDRNDVTLRSKGEAFTFGCTNNGQYLNPSQASWSTSDAAVATVENGKVTATGTGTCTISATYNGKTEKCIVRCNWKDEETEPTETTDNSEWSISHSDVTIGVGESFTLRIVDEDGVTASVTWSASKSGIVSVSGNTVTGTASGVVTLSATVNGETFECIVRVN